MPATRERLLAKAQPQPNGCWLWTGFLDSKGYGRTGFRGRRSTPAHQAFYELFVGPIPDGKVLDHACHTGDLTCPGGAACMHRRCVNPEHLDPVTSQENSSRGANGRRSHCPHGHAYTPENTRHSGGRRFCRMCNRAHKAAQRSRRKAEAR